MHRRAVALWSLLFIMFILCSVALIIMNYTSPGYFIFLGCMFGFILWYWGNVFAFDQGIRGHQNHDGREIENIGSEGTQRSLPATTTPFMLGRIRAEYRQHSQDVQRVAFDPGAHFAWLAIRALPPVKTFNGDDETSGSQHECIICMEEFKNGELIQPFGACVHQFHSSCLNSWLLAGKTTCPVCRSQLSSLH